jgi:hypothetical protein
MRSRVRSTLESRRLSQRHGRSTRESRRLSCLEKVPEDFFHGQRGDHVIRAMPVRPGAAPVAAARILPPGRLAPNAKAGFWSAFDDNPCGSEAGRAE